MPKVTTDVSVRMKTEGAAKAAADTQAVGQRGAQAMAKVDREVQKLEGTFKKLTDKQLELNKLMSEMDDKGGKAYKALQKDMASVQREASQVERTLKNVQRAYKETDATADQAAQRRKREQQQEVQESRRGSFRQGLLQGLIPEAAYLQRGPGMMRQAMGAAIGGRARAGAAGIGQIPFAGAAGLAQAFQSIPGGGFIAAPMMQSVQYAQQALQFRAQRQQMAPFLQMRQQFGPGRMVGETAQQQRARIAGYVDQARLEQQAREQAPAEFQMPSGVGGIAMMGIVGGIAAYRGAKDLFGGTVGQRLAKSRAARERAKKVEAAGGEAAFRRQQEQAEREGDIQAMITVEGGPAQQRRRKDTLQSIIRRQGARMGFALPEAMQMMGGITQAGGGVGAELMTQGLGRAGMAAQRLYGVGPEVTGAFLQAGRRGGVVGGQGRGGAAMVEALAGGMKMGLEGSELTNWMSQMAGDIRSWQQTGIPINTGSVNALGASMAKWGLGGVRGGAIARGIAGRARELTTRGPQGAEELIMLQELGGLQGMGVGAFEEAQLQLEQGGFEPEAVQRIRQVFRRAMRRFGVNVGIEETQRLQTQLAGGEVTPRIKAIRDQIARVGAKAPKDIADIGQKAIAETDPAVRRQIELQNKQIGVGDRMIPFMQNMEESTRKVAEGFTVLAAAPLTKLSGGIKDLADQVPKLANRLKAVTSGDITGVVTGSGEAG
jgi:hypothetical protein